MPIKEKAETPVSLRSYVDYVGNILKNIGWGCVVLGGCWVGYNLAALAFNVAIMATLMGGGFTALAVGERLTYMANHPEQLGFIGQRIMNFAGKQIGYFGATLKLVGRMSLMAGGFQLGMTALAPGALFSVVAALCLTVVPLSMLGILRTKKSDKPDYSEEEKALARDDEDEPVPSLFYKTLDSLRSTMRSLMNIRFESNVYSAAGSIGAGFSAFICVTAALAYLSAPALGALGALLGATMLYYANKTDSAAMLLIIDAETSPAVSPKTSKENDQSEQNEAASDLGIGIKPIIAPSTPIQTSPLDPQASPFDEFSPTPKPATREITPPAANPFFDEIDSPPQQHSPRLFTPPKEQKTPESTPKEYPPHKP